MLGVDDLAAIASVLNVTDISIFYKERSPKRNVDIERNKMNELKIPEIIGDIEIDLNQHEVLMVMRGNRPPMLVVSGNLLNGISQVVATSRLFENRVTVTFNEYINSNPFPYDDFDVLQTLLSENPKKLSARDIVIEKRLGEHSYQDRQKNYAEQ